MGSALIGANATPPSRATGQAVPPPTKHAPAGADTRTAMYRKCTVPHVW